MREGVEGGGIVVIRRNISGTSLHKHMLFFLVDYVCVHIFSPHDIMICTRTRAIHSDAVFLDMHTQTRNTQ